MPYPIVKDSDARAWWKEWSRSEETATSPSLPEVGTSPNGGDHDWQQIASALIQELSKQYSAVDGYDPEPTKPGIILRLTGKSEKKGKLSNERFEARACVTIHRSLPEDDALSDPEFWIWMACHPGLELIKRRYPVTEKKPLPDRNNFTSSSARESFFYRLWVRAELAFDEQRVDPYELAEYGDIDFWRSHVFRQMSTESGSLLAAFIAFQHPNGPDGPKRLNQSDIRELVKFMRRAAANIIVETLDDKSAKDFVEAQWRKIQALRKERQAAE